MAVLSEALAGKIKALLPRYPHKQAVTLPALHLVQEQFGCVPTEAMAEIAQLLDLAPSEVHDTMSFYNFFKYEHQPLGQTRVWVCHSLACALRGGEEVLWHLCNTLGLESPGNTSQDGKVTVEVAECLGGCEGAPCLLVNDEHQFNVSVEQAEQLARELSA